VRCDVARRWQALRQNPERCNDDARLNVRKFCENRQPLRDDVLMWRKVVPGQSFPLDEMDNARVGACEKANFRGSSANTTNGRSPTLCSRPASSATASERLAPMRRPHAISWPVAGSRVPAGMSSGLVNGSQVRKLQRVAIITQTQKSPDRFRAGLRNKMLRASVSGLSGSPCHTRNTRQNHCIPSV